MNVIQVSFARLDAIKRSHLLIPGSFFRMQACFLSVQLYHCATRVNPPPAQTILPHKRFFWGGRGGGGVTST